ncbi:MAG: hypothetical protein NT074_03190 [Methanomicrobiales archaeon]|nr:hypothetical protein [Methanomicrobiales archaeon]
MSALIDGLLTYSRAGRHTLDIQEIDMGWLVQEVYDEIMSGHVGRDVRLTLHPLPLMHADSFLIRLVWRTYLKMPSSSPVPGVLQRWRWESWFWKTSRSPISMTMGSDSR